MNRRRIVLAVVVLLAGIGVWLGLWWLEHSLTEQPYSLIEKNLYVGGIVPSPPPGTGAVVNLCQREDRYQVDTYLAEPLDGSVAPTIEWLRRIVEFIDSQRRAGVTTYVHCMAGMNRSGMVVTAYLMYEHGWTRDEALAFAQSKRPQIQPNPLFMGLLLEWEKIHKEST